MKQDFGIRDDQVVRRAWLRKKWVLPFFLILACLNVHADMSSYGNQAIKVLRNHEYKERRLKELTEPLSQLKNTSQVAAIEILADAKYKASKLLELLPYILRINNKFQVQALQVLIDSKSAIKNNIELVTQIDNKKQVQVMEELADEGSSLLFNRDLILTAAEADQLLASERRRNEPSQEFSPDSSDGIQKKIVSGSRLALLFQDGSFELFDLKTSETIFRNNSVGFQARDISFVGSSLVVDLQNGRRAVYTVSDGRYLFMYSPKAKTELAAPSWMNTCEVIFDAN